MKDTPIFINCRDRVSCLKQQIDWLESAGYTNITILDNDSAYIPLLEYYVKTSYEVLFLNKNYGHLALWKSKIFEHRGLKDKFFIYTDPDIIPKESCPLDVIEYFAEIIKENENVVKVGFSLEINDLPEHYKFKSAVEEWEGYFWKTELDKTEKSKIYRANIDTTFALYNKGFDFNAPSWMDHMKQSFMIRTGTPYTARHTEWYVDSDNLDEESGFYKDRIEHVTAWSGRK